jgi:murein DD-endopeptidase MepM/ murein hydrolase activator NlpD
VVVWTKTPAYTGGYGNQVMINHGEIPLGGSYWASSYNHLSAFNVSAGQTVLRGDVIGFAGTTGTSTGCHLHFEIYKDGVHLDPMTILPPLH